MVGAAETTATTAKPLAAAATAAPPKKVVALPQVNRKLRRALVVDEAAKRQVTAYLLSHFVGTREAPPADAFCLLIGPTGDGKSTLLQALCEELGFPIVVMALGNCADANEGGAQDKFKAFFTECEKKGAVGVLEDAHLSLLTVTDTSVPSGGPLIMSTLMEIADKCRDGRTASQPLILTANKREGLGAALTRAGRTRVVYMKSTWGLRRRQLVARLSDEGLKGWLAAHYLALRYPRRSVAFLQNVIGVAAESRTLEVFDRAGGNLEVFKTLMAVERPRFSFTRVRAAGRRAVANETASKGGVV